MFSSVTKKPLIGVSADLQQTPGTPWVQYSLYHKNESEKIGEALLKLDDQWQTVPREALVNWLKFVLMTELANTLVKVDAVTVSIEMPLGNPVSNEQVHECLLNGFIDISIVAPRPGEAQFQFPAMHSDPVLDPNTLQRQWQMPGGMPSANHFISPGQQHTAVHSLQLEGVPFSPGLISQPQQQRQQQQQQQQQAQQPLKQGKPRTEKRRRQEKWTEHECMVLLESKKEEELEHARLSDGEKVRSGIDRWNRTADIMKGKGVMDREGKNCEDKMTNLKRDFFKIREYNNSQGDPMRFWTLELAEKKQHKLPQHMDRKLYEMIESLDCSKFRGSSANGGSANGDNGRLPISPPMGSSDGGEDS